MTAAYEVYGNANMGEGRPFPIVYKEGDMMDGWGRLRALADSPEHIVPGHDPEVLVRYPAPSEPLRGVVARLD
jgi:glyoxylase-like metal-dependent hydrolase (beta-lactamase superfamily II)